MNITVNGEAHMDIQDGTTLHAFLSALALPLTKLAVERNLEIVPKSTYAEIVLKDGDRLEVVHFIGGG